MDADQAALRSERLEHAVAEARARHGGERVVARHHRRAARLDQLQVHRLGPVRDVDEHAQAVHLLHKRPAAVVDALVVLGLLPALHRRERAVGEGVEAGLRGELHRAQAQAIERRKHVQVALMVEPRLHAEEHRHPPARDDAPRVRHAERHAHLVRVLLRVLVERLDQPQRLLGRVVIVPVAVGADVVDDAVHPRGPGARVVPAAVVRHPGIDLFPVDPVGDVDVAVHHHRHIGVSGPHAGTS